MSILRGGAEELFAPVPEKKQSRRNRVEQSALGHEHGQRNTFPGDRSSLLVIEELERGQELETGETAVEQEAGYPKRAAPAEESIKSCERREQRDPDQTAHKIDMHTAEQRVKQIDAGRISQFAENIDRIVRPKRNAVGEVFDVSDVQREIAEIVGRLNSQFLAIFVEQPAKGADRKNDEARGQHPKPNRSIAAGRRRFWIRRELRFLQAAFRALGKFSGYLLRASIRQT